MAAPSLQVWLGEEATIDAAPSWVDISAYVRLEQGITVTRGSTRGGGTQPGTASLTLDNTDARFTVGNTGSPYYPYVHLQSLVKILRDGRPWFIGRIQSMPLSWPTGGDDTCWVQVTLADRLARFGRMSLAAFHVEEVLATPDPYGNTIGANLGVVYGAYYPLTESSGASQASDISTAQLPPLLPSSTFGNGTLTFGSSAGMRGDGGVVLTPVGGGASLTAQFPFLPGGVALTFSTLAGGLLYSCYSGSLTTSISVENYLTVAGVMVRQSYVGGASSWFFPCNVMDQLPHSLVFSLTVTTPLVYVDGVALTATATVGVTVGSSGLGTVFIGAGSGVNPFSGTVAHFAAWLNALDATGMSRISAAFVGTTLTTNAAMLKVLGWRNQAATALIDSGVTNQVPSTAIGGGTLAGVLGEISDSEAGTLWVDGQDRLTWKNRRTGLSPAISLSAADIDETVTYNCDIQGLVTRVTWSQGGTSGAVKAADYDTIGEISGSVSSISTVTGDGADHASMLANTSPRGPYIGSLAIDMMTATAPVAALVATTGILSKITLTGMPSQTPPGSTVLEVTGESETISHTTWRVTYTTKPAGLGSARDLLITDDAIYGVTDSTHRVAY